MLFFNCCCCCIFIMLCITFSFLDGGQFPSSFFIDSFMCYFFYLYFYLVVVVKKCVIKCLISRHQLFTSTNFSAPSWHFAFLLCRCWIFFCRRGKKRGKTFFFWYFGSDKEERRTREKRSYKKHVFISDFFLSVLDSPASLLTTQLMSYVNVAPLMCKKRENEW